MRVTLQRFSAKTRQALITTAAAASIFPAAAMAHPGHDHGHWASSAVHVLALLAAASVIVAGSWILVRSRRQRAAQRLDRSKRD